jgi:hypothetical protein
MVAEITLQASTVYKDLSWVASSFRDSVFRIVSVEDDGGTPVETEQVQGIIAGSGALVSSGSLPNFEFTSGSTGVQKLKILAKNVSALSDMRATIAIKEEQL